MHIRPRSATVNAAGVFTDPITVKDGCDVFFENTDFKGTITVQSRSCDSTVWNDEDRIPCDGNNWHRRYPRRKVEYRAGCKDGDYTSGSARVVVQG